MVNLGAQVSVPQLVERAREEKADAVLVSQVVTQRDAHLLNTREMSAAFREAYPAEKRPLLVVGGPRFDEAMAGELGVDRVFTRGTTPGEVASFLVAPDHSSREGVLMASTTDARAAPPSCTAATCPTPTPTTPATWSTAPTRSACSATSPPRCASAPTATRGCSRRTPTCSSSQPVRAGDVLEVTCTLVRVGTRSRALDFTVHVVARGAATEDRPGAAEVLAEPLLATSATGTVVVPPRVR